MKFKNVANHQDSFALLSEGDQLAGFRDTKRERLFHEYIFSTLERLAREVPVQHCRGGNHDRLNRRIEKNLVVRLCRADAVLLPYVVKSVDLGVTDRP